MRDMRSVMARPACGAPNLYDCTEIHASWNPTVGLLGMRMRESIHTAWDRDVCSIVRRPSAGVETKRLPVHASCGGLAAESGRTGSRHIVRLPRER